MTRLSAAFIAAVAAVALILPPALARADDGAAALLAKHRAFVGWQLGDGTFNTLRITGKHVNDKGETNFTFTQVRAGLAVRSTYVNLKRAGVADDDGFTGNIFWQSNANGFTTPVFGDKARLGLAEDVVFTEALTSLAGTARGPATVDGKSVQIVRVTLKTGDVIDAYVDPATGAFDQVVLNPDGNESETIHILDYLEVSPGKRIIAKYRYGDSTSTWSVDKAEPNPVLTEADLHPPAPRATWAFTSPKAFPFKVTDTRFIVDAKVNGVPGRFLLDTGSFSILLTREFAAKAHAKPFTTSTGYGIGGSVHQEVDRLDTVEIGGNTLSNVIAYSSGDSFDGDAPDGLIGFDLFGGAIVRLDTSAGQMTIEDPATASVDASSGVALNVDLSGGTPSVPMKMDGNVDVNAMLDSGNFYYVLFSSDLVLKHGVKMLVDNSVVGYLQSHPVIGGVGGYEVERCGHVDSLALGPIIYSQPPACESQSFSGRDILVGFDFLRHFNFIFDYPHGHLIMSPRKDE